MRDVLVYGFVSLDMNLSNILIIKRISSHLEVIYACSARSLKLSTLLLIGEDTVKKHSN